MDVSEILERARRTGDRREIETAIERINAALDEPGYSPARAAQDGPEPVLGFSGGRGPRSRDGALRAAAVVCTSEFQMVVRPRAGMALCASASRGVVRGARRGRWAETLGSLT